MKNAENSVVCLQCKPGRDRKISDQNAAAHRRFHERTRHSRRGGAWIRYRRAVRIGEATTVALPDIRADVGMAAPRRWTLALVLGSIISGAALALALLWIGRLLGLAA